MPFCPPLETSILREVPKYIFARSSLEKKKVFILKRHKTLQDVEGRDSHYFQIIT